MMEGRKSSASSFAARLGLRPLSAINPEDARRGSHAQTYSPGSSRASSPASSRRSSHAEPVSMSSLPSKSIGQYPQRNEAAPLKYRRPSSVAGDLAQTSAKKEKESPVAPGIHARKASTVERNPNLVRRGSSAYGSGLTGGRLSMTTPLARDDIDDAQGHEDREERLRNNTSALVLAAKNLLGSDVTNQDAAGDTELARLLKMLFWDAAKVQQEIADIPIHGSSIDKAQTIMALKEFGTQLLNLLSQVASNSTFQSMWSAITAEFSPLWSSVEPQFTQPLHLADMLSALQTTVLAAPAYQHVFLQVLASFSKLWSSCSVLRESFFTSASEHWEGLTHSKTLLEAIDATLTQLTGLPFPPFLRSLLHLFFDFNDVIDLFVAEMSSFLTQPLPLSVPEVYERHPATGMPYCPAEASTRVRIIMHRFHSLLQHQPLAASITKALARSRKVCEAITGNSAVLRFYRAFKRLAADLVQVDQSGTFQLLAEPDELAAVLRHIAQGLGRVSLEPISSNTEEGHIELRNVTFEATDIVPNHVSVSNATDWSFGNGIQQQIRVTLEGMHVDAPSVSFSYSKGSAGLPESGSADIHLAFDLRLLFSPGTGALPVFEHVAVKVKACDVSMKGTGKDTLYQLAWPLVRNTMVGHVQVAIEDFISSKLAFIFSRPDAEPITPLSKVLRAQSKSVASTPRTEGPTETYLSARARFRREITGITTSLQSGDLDNPLEDSVPSSPILPTGPKPRAGSMASYLSEAATADATDLKNIQRPPRARGASMAYALDSNSESDEEARPMSATSRRHTAPDAGMDIDAYEAAAQDLEHSEQQRRRMTMSATLSELTSRDTTTIDGVRNPPKHEKDDQPELPPTMQRNMSMDHVTRALSGLADRELASPNVAAKPMRASPMPMSPRPQGQPPAGLSRRKSMSEWLNDKAMQDHTQLSKPGGDYDVPHKHGVPTTTGPVEIPTKERRDSAMRRSLTDTSAVDGTVGSFFKTAPTKAHIGRKLPDNIASPPGSTSHSRASSFARSKPSFTGLKNRFSMAESLDAELEEDETVPGRALGRRKSSATSGPTGLSLEELRQRRQSFKLDDKATMDGTMLENVTSPPVAEPGILEQEQKNPLSRRPSTVLHRG